MYEKFGSLCTQTAHKNKQTVRERPCKDIMRSVIVGGCMLWRHWNQLKVKLWRSKRQKSVFTARDVALKCANYVCEKIKIKNHAWEPAVDWKQWRCIHTYAWQVVLKRIFQHEMKKITQKVVYKPTVNSLWRPFWK